MYGRPLRTTIDKVNRQLRSQVCSIKIYFFNLEDRLAPALLSLHFHLDISTAGLVNTVLHCQTRHPGRTSDIRSPLGMDWLGWLANKGAICNVCDSQIISQKFLK